MIEKMLFVSDGIIAIMGSGKLPVVSLDSVIFSFAEYGVELRVSDVRIPLPVEALEHLEQAEGTMVHFYQSDPYSLVADYNGCIEINRDEILKLKGAWEYSQPHQ